MTANVVVLMSTFNGTKYVVEQLQSILWQLPPQGRIMVRDDGSTDGTAQLVAALGDNRITILQGENLGFGASFLTLLMMVPGDTDMVMFADQDDVWLPGKIARAWQQLQPHEGRPALYGSAQTLVDSRLRRLKVTPPWSRGPSLTSALTENIITGCTAAINRYAIGLMQQAGVPSGVYFHDWWCYLVVSAFGTVVYDDQSLLLYRQHGANQIGHGAGWFARQLGILRFLLRHDWVALMLGQIWAFRNHFASTAPEAVNDLVCRHFEFDAWRARARWKIIFGKKQWRQTWRQEVLFRILLLSHMLRLWPPPWHRSR